LEDVFGVVVGDQLSDLNGNYTLDDWTFSHFNPDVYSLHTMEFTSNLDGEITDVGAVTLTVVPEPTCATLFGLTALGLAIRRRK
jgi:hypothetical protein